MKIPFNVPAFVGRELEHIEGAILQQKHISGDGFFTKKCSEFIESTFNVPKVLLTTSCTDALEMSALLLSIEPGDEIIFPSFTFVSTLNAFVLRGARPVFADIRPDTLNLDETKLESLLSKKTKAIVPVHYAGVACEMDAIMALAKNNSIAVVEDNAHGLYGKYKNQYLGTFGDFATQSFHETKNFSSGEGGALLINNERYADRAEIIREKGTNRSQFFRGQVNKYGWMDVGSSFLPSDILAAHLLAQLESAERIQSKRKQIFHRYATDLKPWSEKMGFKLPFVPEHCEQSYHMFYMLAPSLEIRTKFIGFLKENGISAVFHYLPLHKSEMARKMGLEMSELSVTERISDTLVRLPFFFSLSEEQQSYIVDIIARFQNS